jgi:hypothetical protein
MRMNNGKCFARRSFSEGGENGVENGKWKMDLTLLPKPDPMRDGIDRK